MTNEQETAELKAWQWARDNQGYTGDFSSWLKLSKKSRSEYESGAAGLPTA